MIYDITDIINETHQFSCLIEGGHSARLARLKDFDERTSQNRHLLFFIFIFFYPLPLSPHLSLS